MANKVKYKTNKRMNKPVNIVLVHRTGGDFKIADAYLLTSHILKYWDDEVKPNIYCYTDSVKKPINVVGLKILPLPNKEWKGWWAKMNLFAPELKDVRPFLYLDLDTAVLKSLRDLIPPEEHQTKFVALRDFYQPTKLASGLMWVPNTEVINTIYAEWSKNPIASIRKFRGDQNFIASVVSADVFWQDISKPDFITTFKPNKKWRVNLPEQSAVVCFHGTPRIPEAAKTVQWVKSYLSYEI